MDGAGWTAVRLDDVEALPWQGTELIWRPLRGVLRTHVAGMAAFTADRAGQEVVEGHTEMSAGRGHEEVYEVNRRAVATEPGTAVLALGGPATFQPSASEWIERARAYAHSDPARARAVVDELRAVRPHSRGIGIGEAILAVAEGDRASAVAALSALLEREPDLRGPLAADPDLGPLVSDL